jgi:hypothetical protein
LEGGGGEDRQIFFWNKKSKVNPIESVNQYVRLRSIVENLRMRSSIFLS